MADADKINQNFNYVLENASGGCTVEQVDSSAKITCADGSTAVVPGYGTVVVYPEGGIIGDSPITSWPAGAIVFMDANGAMIAEASTGVGSTTVVLDGSRGAFYNDPQTESVELTGWGGGSDLYFLGNDCSGQSFVIGLAEGSVGPFYEKEGALYVRDSSAVIADILFESKQRSAWAEFGTNTYRPDGECISGQFVVASQPAITYTPAPEITQRRLPSPTRAVALAPRCANGASSP